MKEENKKYLKELLKGLLDTMLILLCTAMTGLITLLNLNNPQRHVMQLLFDLEIHSVLLLILLALFLIGTVLASILTFIINLIMKLIKK